MNMYLQSIPAHSRKVDLSCRLLQDQDLAGLERFSRLEELDLSYTAISDEGLRILVQIPRLRATLRRLNLTRTKTTDAGLQYLSALPNLEELVLEFTDVSDTGLDHLSGLKSRLQRLYAEATRVTRERMMAFNGPVAKA